MESNTTESNTTERVWLGYPAATTRTGLSATTLWRARRRGDLRASGSGRGIRFHRDELDRFMDARGGRGRG